MTLLFGILAVLSGVRRCRDVVVVGRDESRNSNLVAGDWNFLLAWCEFRKYLIVWKVRLTATQSERPGGSWGIARPLNGCGARQATLRAWARQGRRQQRVLPLELFRDARDVGGDDIIIHLKTRKSAKVISINLSRDLELCTSTDQSGPSLRKGTWFRGLRLESEGPSRPARGAKAVIN